jgi:hypothetical protein
MRYKACLQRTVGGRGGGRGRGRGREVALLDLIHIVHL